MVARKIHSIALSAAPVKENNGRDTEQQHQPVQKRGAGHSGLKKKIHQTEGTGVKSAQCYGPNTLGHSGPIKSERFYPLLTFRAHHCPQEKYWVENIVKVLKLPLNQVRKAPRLHN
jgi:hypothetical protein